MQYPAFYNPDNAAEWGYSPDSAKIFEESLDWRRQHKIAPAAKDRFTIEVVGIDVQRDFCYPRGSLYVAGRSGTGAIDDNRRIAEFIYRNLGVITEVTPTMDTHVPYQIFFPSFWEDDSGVAAPPHTVISVEDIQKGKWKPSPTVAHLANGNYGWIAQYARHYAGALEKAGKYQLYIWPYHCLLGSDGHVLAGVFEEARLFHSFVRGQQSLPNVKGGSPFTENYSVFGPEVLTSHDGHTVGQRSTAFLEKLLRRDAVVFVGQAASHCVKSSIDDVLDEISKVDPDLARKVYVVKDCMSAVTVPDGQGGFIADFTPQTEEALKRFADAGMRVVESTTDIRDWPGINL